MKITLIEPKSPDSHIFSLYALPRLGTLLLGTILRDRGHDVSVTVESIKPVSWDDVITSDLVGISTTTSTAPRAYEMADSLRNLGITTVMGGPHVTFLPEEALAHTDYVIRGEGERFLVCSFCSHEWRTARIGCPFCENKDQKTLHYFFSDEEKDYRVHVCDQCKKYVKTIDTRKMERPFHLRVEQISTLHLDMLAQEKGLESGIPLWLQT